MGKRLLSLFAGYVSAAGGQLVQDWYDKLPETAREELQDTLNYLASTPPWQWKRPEFDKVESPLHEIRCKDSEANHWIRIYGVFDKNVRGRFIFLYGNQEKKVNNDKNGKKIALDRFALLEQGKATTHEFVIETRIAPENQKK